MVRIFAAFCWAVIAGAAGAADSAPMDGKVHGIKVLPDKAPDCSSLRAIVESVTRGCKTNDEKAIALYNFMQLTHYHQGYPVEQGGVGALKEINVYGWSLCGGLHTVEAALWREAGWKWRYVGWSNPGHTTGEAQYDGRWHYLDVFLKYYSWIAADKAPGGRTIAGEDDLKANPDLIVNGLEFDRGRGVYYHKGDKFENVGGKANWLAPSFLNCGDEPAGIVSGLKSSKPAGSPTGWGEIGFDSPGYAADVNLAPGYALTLCWDNMPGASWFNGRNLIPKHGCNDKDYRNDPVTGPIFEPYHDTGMSAKSYANGILSFTPDFNNDKFLNSLIHKENVKFDEGKLVPADPGKPASVTVGLQSPYILCRGSVSADGAELAELSIDGGKSFKKIQLEHFSEGFDDKNPVYDCQIRLTFKTALKSLKLAGIVQCNRGALPYLSPGKNKITVTVADPKQLGDNLLFVTYAYELGSRSRSYEQMADAGASVGKGQFANWSNEPILVRKSFRAGELPATFEIDVPTPKGKYPVYPRMLFMRRDIAPPKTDPYLTVFVSLDPERLKAYDLTAQQVADALNKACLSALIETKGDQASLSIHLQARDRETLLNLSLVGDHDVYLRDVGSIVGTVAEKTTVQPNQLLELKTLPNPFTIGAQPPAQK